MNTPFHLLMPVIGGVRATLPLKGLLRCSTPAYSPLVSRRVHPSPSLAETCLNSQPRRGKKINLPPSNAVYCINFREKGPMLFPFLFPPTATSAVIEIRLALCPLAYCILSDIESGNREVNQHVVSQSDLPQAVPAVLPVPWSVSGTFLDVLLYLFLSFLWFSLHHGIVALLPSSSIVVRLGWFLSSHCEKLSRLADS